MFREANVLDDDAQAHFAGRFGLLTNAHPTVASVDGKPAVLPVDRENGSANNWYTDVTFVVPLSRSPILTPMAEPTGPELCSGRPGLTRLHCNSDSIVPRTQLLPPTLGLAQ